VQIVKDLLKILSEGEKDEDIKLDILGNVYGFYKMSGGSGSSTLILETATLLAKEDIKVCIIDADPLSSFYINKFIGCEETQKTCNNSIMSRLMNSTLPIKNCLVSTPNENLKILGFGLQTGYKDIFNLDFDSINKLFLEAKEYFDVVSYRYTECSSHGASIKCSEYFKRNI
jgi:cellulose biosynthesis protein BcsQ